MTKREFEALKRRIAKAYVFESDDFTSIMDAAVIECNDAEWEWVENWEKTEEGKALIAEYEAKRASRKKTPSMYKYLETTDTQRERYYYQTRIQELEAEKAAALLHGKVAGLNEAVEAARSWQKTARDMDVADDSRVARFIIEDLEDRLRNAEIAAPSVK
jgi:hypothetical protein